MGLQKQEKKLQESFSALVAGSSCEAVSHVRRLMEMSSKERKEFYRQCAELLIGAQEDGEWLGFWYRMLTSTAEQRTNLPNHF